MSRGKGIKSTECSNRARILVAKHRERTTKVESFSKMAVFSSVKLVKNQKVVFLHRFLSLRPVALKTAASKRFHKFWFLVLENPGFGWDFLVLWTEIKGGLFWNAT